MARKRKRDDSGGASWMETYSDLVTLLLTFFILLYSMSTIDAQKYAMIVEAFSKGDVVVKEDGLSGKGDTFNGSVEDTQKEQEKPVEDIDALYNSIEKYIKDNNLQDSAQVSKTEEYVFIRFSDEITFSGYSNNLNDSGKKVLDVLAKGLTEVDKYIEEVIIAGHTAEVNSDNSKIDRTLSTDRANAVLNYLETKNAIDPAKYLAIGYGLYSPIADNNTVAGRSKNRRVEIYISRKGHPISYTNIINGKINENKKESTNSDKNNSDTSKNDENINYKKSMVLN